MQSKFGGKVSHWAWAKNAGVTCGPGTVGFEVFALAAESVVDAAVQHHFPRTALDSGERNFAEKRDRIVIELVPTDGIEVAKQADSIVVPAPANIAREGP